MTQVYKQLSTLIHLDKQPDEWKTKASQAQQSKSLKSHQSSQTDHNSELNDARDKFNISFIPPEAATERPKRSHKVFWDATPFIGSVRRLQIDPSNERAVAFVEKVNSDIEAHNNEKGYNSSRGKFPLKYLQDKYQNTQALRTTYKDTTDPEQKKELAAIFEALCVATQEFCEERASPEAWAWQYADINKEPAWLSEAEGSQSASVAGTGDGADTGTGIGTDPGTGTDPSTGTGTSTDPSTGTGTSTGLGLGLGLVLVLGPVLAIKMTLR